MKFKIDLPIPPNPVLNYRTPIITVGSCFADRMSSKLSDSRFEVLGNPFGVLYNPISIVNGFLDINNGINEGDDLIEANGLWHSWHHHGQFSSPNKSDLVDHINLSKNLLKSKLELPKVTILITLGSAWVYSYDGQIVANCHKISESAFTKRLLKVDEVSAPINKLVERYPQHDFVFTVSPVRYTRDGLHESNLSKSVLHLALNDVTTNRDNCSYFPAYEIVMDELRDYRFFERDLVHPNDLAIDYVWEVFKNSFIDEASQQMINAWVKVQLMMQHRVLHPDTKEAQSFAKKLEEKKLEFESAFF